MYDGLLIEVCLPMSERFPWKYDEYDCIHRVLLEMESTCVWYQYDKWCLLPSV